MQTAFDEAWRHVRRIAPGQLIPKWSWLGRATGSFVVASTDAESVIVKSEGIDGERRVSRTDFANVFEVWEGYRSGVVPRQRINDITRNSTYVLAILHWAENSN